MTSNVLGYYSGFPFSNPVVKFYAIFILGGACLAWFLANYRAHKDGFDYHFFDAVFPVGFLSGIVGARIWYVIASWDSFSAQPWYAVFEIWNGGLAIQGGIIGGVLAGVIFCLFRRKGTSILKITDYAVPTILIAQAIGRWGNFFNQEVFGHFVSAESWNFLPSFITNNMQNGTLSMGQYIYNDAIVGVGSIKVPEGSIAAPLFLVEGVVNVMFYILLSHGLPAIEGKRYRNGDQTFAYFIAYGITRAILEPLRNPAFIMGAENLDKSTFKSLTMAIVFIVIGLVLFILNHVLAFLALKGKFDKYPAFKLVFTDGIIADDSEPIIEEETPVKDDEDVFEKLRLKEDEIKKEDKDGQS